jgi:hypothetical protein
MPEVAPHYTWLVLLQDADGRRSYAVRTSATPEIEAGEDAMVTVGPATVGPDGDYATDAEAVEALAAAAGIDLAAPDTWDALLEDTLEDDGIVMI